jgi:hypothetical protein
MNRYIQAALMRRWTVLFTRLGLCVGIGLFIAGLFWWGGFLLPQGKSIAAAFRGEVDDGLPTLQAAAVIGGAVGGAVGLFYGFLAFGADAAEDAVKRNPPS